MARAWVAAVAARVGQGATAARAHLARVAAGSVLVTAAAVLATAATAPAAAAAVLAAAATAPAAAAGNWQRPVPGPVTRSFDYGDDPFAAGRHRGVDFAVRTGATVRSACAGRVVFAGTAGSSGPTVSVRCGPWRVAYLPLRTITVRRGAHVERGARLGTAAGAGARGAPVPRGSRLGTVAGAGRHDGLHVGVRREGRRWAYVDPLAFFGARAPLPVPVSPAPRAVRTPPRARPAPVPRVPVASPRGGLVSVPRPASVAARVFPAPHASGSSVPASTRALAPWPAWAGLTLVLAGVCGAGLSRLRRRDGLRSAPPAARAEQREPSGASA